LDAVSRSHYLHKTLKGKHSLFITPLRGGDGWIEMLFYLNYTGGEKMIKNLIFSSCLVFFVVSALCAKELPLKYRTEIGIQAGVCFLREMGI